MPIWKKERFEDGAIWVRRSEVGANAEALAAAALLLVFALAAGAALRRFLRRRRASAHPLGWLYWKSGRFAGDRQSAARPVWITAPLVASGRSYLYPSDAHLAWCRVPVLLLGIGLGSVLWRWGRALAGRAGGLAALAAFALEPNLLAHAHLATLDLPVTALWWAALWAWRRSFVAGAPAGPRGWLGFVFLAAAATLTKFTGLLIFPAVWLVARDAPGSRHAAPCDRRNRARARRPVSRSVRLWLRPIERVAAGLVASVSGKMVHREEVHFAYLAVAARIGFLAYYPIAILLKTPLPLLCLAGVGAVALWRRGARRDLALLVVPAAIVCIAFALIRVNVGVRHVLPLYPALVLLAATGGVALGRRGRVGMLALGLAVSLWIAGVARTTPQWLAYFNVLAGGPAGGHRWLLDSI